MARRKITNRFDAYNGFLKTLIQSLETNITENEQKIALYNAIISIIDKRKMGISVSNEEYEALAAYSCPEVDVIELFDGAAEYNAEGAFTSDIDRLLFICPDTSCTACWQNFINIITECINQSGILVKMFEKLDEAEENYAGVEKEVMHVSFKDFSEILSDANNGEHSDDNN